MYLHSHDTGRYVQPYGYPVSTPNIQRFAQQGVLFRQAFAASPTCSPSRAALLTGQYPHCCGMHGLASTPYGYRLDHYEHHLARFLRDGHGFDTALAGVQHEARKPWVDPAELGYNHWLNHDDAGNADAITTHRVAADFLHARPHNSPPFFLSVGFNETHRHNPTGGGAHGYDPDLLEAEPDPRYCQPPPGIPDTPITRQDAAHLKRGAERLDEKIGHVLDALERSGHTDQTLVILTTDHGLAWPNAKGNLTDQGLAVMLMMRGPEPTGFTGGRVVDALVSHMDLYPTLCDLQGFEHPDWLQGQSIMPLIRGEQTRVHDVLFAEQGYHCLTPDPQRSVRTRRYRYTLRGEGPYLPVVDPGPTNDWMQSLGYAAQPTGHELLYDLWFDPTESCNLASSPEHQTILARLRQQLNDWMRQTHDPFLTGTIPPPPTTCTPPSTQHQPPNPTPSP